MSTTVARDIEAYVRDEKRVDWHDESLWHIRSKRDRSTHGLPEWEQLRQTASQIKEHVISKLPDLLEEFERNATANGVKVHWARDAQEHNEIVVQILQSQQIDKVVKSKSMLTEECKLNHHLEKHAIQVVDTDLGERIVQLRDEEPSHIVLPAIHLKKEEIGELFHEHLGTDKGAADPKYLTEAARQHLRTKFLESTAAITGVNFAIAETGGVTICTNEGNADLGVNLARVQIHCMGIEKIIPRWTDLGIFTRLLGRSATGQSTTIYTSHYHKPRPGTEMHIILVDNGRSEHRKREDFRASLKCIRCGACINTCPVYRRAGGHSYGATIPGPIGSILNPTRKPEDHAELPFASSLCGSCTDVCPVKINIHEQLYLLRQDITETSVVPASKTRSFSFLARILTRPRLYRMAGSTARWATRNLPRWAIYHRSNAWGQYRDLPAAPQDSFREWYMKNRTS